MLIYGDGLNADHDPAFTPRMPLPRKYNLMQNRYGLIKPLLVVYHLEAAADGRMDSGRIHHAVEATLPL